MKHYRLLAQLLVALSISFSVFAAIADTHGKSQFSEEQRKELNSIVEEYLMDNPEILIKMSQKLQNQQMQRAQQMKQQAVEKIPKVAEKLFHSNASPVVGNPSGNVTLVEFFDFQCPHCKDMSTVIEGIAQEDGNLRVVHKPLPIFGANSTYAAKAAIAASQQSQYNAFYEALMRASNPLTKKKVLEAAKKVGLNIPKLEKDIDAPTTGKELDNNLRLAQELGITGTPTYVVALSNYTPEKESKAFFVPGSTNAKTLNGYIKQLRNQ